MHSDNEMVRLRDVVETLIYMTDEDSDGVEEVMQLPTIDIVCCRECKYWNEDFILNCRRHTSKVNADDFCSYGCREERSE